MRQHRYRHSHLLPTLLLSSCEGHKRTRLRHPHSPVLCLRSHRRCNSRELRLVHRTHVPFMWIEAFQLTIGCVLLHTLHVDSSVAT